MSNFRYKKPPIFDDIKRALNPHTGFARAAYGHGTSINTRGIWSKGAGKVTATKDPAQARKDARFVHTMRGVVIGGNIASAGLINVGFLINNIVQNRKKSNAEAVRQLRSKLESVIRPSAPKFGLDGRIPDVIHMVEYRFGLRRNPPAVWRQGKAEARTPNPQSGPQSPLHFYNGYVVYEGYLAEQLEKIGITS